ncbi:c-type cytochrome [Edaphobacter modestus]|uniref:Cbb3-type cytochrome c oxidase subunit III n=1 Tax=Edaphobacter modestus TaxID=388466 RepID=A0A4Q7YTF0_9BACT|nr:c-type cytochrome [Edaphobacter modestus]RZU40219.1 cbb3-type cytochrome c oxidase subunit III [Edaphobacter modestus]
MKKPFSKFAHATFLLCLTAAPLRAQFPHSTVDPASADSGAKIYASNCARCHGDDARGTATAPDLLRSLAVLHDRRQMLYGKELGPLLTTGPNHNFKYDEKQLADLSQFLTASVNGILRSGYNAEPTNLLSGDATAGETYFNGAGGCSRCHSATGDLAGLAKRYPPSALQQKFLFPNYGLFIRRKVQVTVNLPSGKIYTGDLIRIDDFTIALREKSGQYRSFNRTAGTKVTTVDPFAAHADLLDKYTDTDIHNMTTYLATLK